MVRETEIIDNDAWKSLGTGFMIALVALLVPFLGFIFGYLGILVHELGHAVAAWMFGYPAVPAFDFQYGGMDFSRIAEEYLHTDLSTVAFLFLVCCLLPPVLVYLTYRHRTSIRVLLGRLLVSDPGV